MDSPLNKYVLKRIMQEAHTYCFQKKQEGFQGQIQLNVNYTNGGDVSRKYEIITKESKKVEE